MTQERTLQDPFVWIDPADAVFVAACREALAIERKAYAAADQERRALLADTAAAHRAQLRALVDVVWNCVTESEEVPSTKTADRLIDQVFGGAP